MPNVLIPEPLLSSITLHLSVQGEAWGGFMAERDSMATYAPKDWPGLRKAIADLCGWDDCIRDTVRPYYGQLHWHLTNKHGHSQTLVKELLL